MNCVCERFQASCAVQLKPSLLWDVMLAYAMSPAIYQPTSHNIQEEWRPQWRMRLFSQYSAQYTLVWGNGHVTARSYISRRDLVIVNRDSVFLKGNYPILCSMDHASYNMAIIIQQYATEYLLTPWCRVLLEKLTGLQLVKKFRTFHGTRRFITALTSVRHLSLSWASPIQST